MMPKEKIVLQAQPSREINPGGFNIGGFAFPINATLMTKVKIQKGVLHKANSVKWR